MLTRGSVAVAACCVAIACLPAGAAWGTADPGAAGRPGGGGPARAQGGDGVAMVSVQGPEPAARGAHTLLEATWARLPLLTDDSAVSADPAARRAQDAWIAGGSLPGPDDRADLAEQTLRDLDGLVLADGSVLAAAAPGWDLVWPRDASFVAVALARSDHVGDSFAVLARLAALHATSADGVFEARYVAADGSTPDERPRQLDGCGWALWAVGEWWAAADDQDRAGLATLSPMVTGCLDAIDREVDPVTGLPGAWPDYWEVAERGPTLGTVAALAAGVAGIAPVAEVLGGERPTQVEELAGRLRVGVAAFSPDYPRHLTEGERDTAVAFLMPPFVDQPSAQVLAAWSAALHAMRRPGGGLAPGEGWRQDGVSWTPSTALFALAAAASGDRATAAELLDWLDQHRTPAGALPEKVLADGSPAGPAPLAWTSALVLLTLDALDRQSIGAAGPPAVRCAPAVG